jgi:hypothetical protein
MKHKKMFVAAILAFSFGLGLTSASAYDPMCERACRSLQSECWAEVYALCQEGCFDP